MIFEMILVSWAFTIFGFGKNDEVQNLSHIDAMKTYLEDTIPSKGCESSP